MSRKGWPQRLLIIACLGVLGVRSAVGIDLHLQDLPPAPGLRPSEALESLSGLREAVNCGLDFLDTAQRCGLSAPSKVVSPFLVRFDPMFCRLTMRFSIGEWIDGLLKQWIAGAFARLSSPAIGALCLLGIGAGILRGQTRGVVSAFPPHPAQERGGAAGRGVLESGPRSIPCPAATARVDSRTGPRRRPLRPIRPGSGVDSVFPRPRDPGKEP
jgi:hypothetical protein